MGSAHSAVLIGVGKKHGGNIFPGKFAPKSSCVVQAGNKTFSPKSVQNHPGALLLLTSPHLNPHHGISCLSLAEMWCKGALGEGSRSDQEGSAVWDLESERELHSNKMGFPRHYLHS